MARCNHFALILISLFAKLAYGFSSPSEIIVSRMKFDEVYLMRRAFVQPNSSKNIYKKSHKNTCLQYDRDMKKSSSSAFALTRGGEISEQPSVAQSIFKIISSLWASSGVVYILMKAVKRVMPIAMEPFQQGAAVPLTSFQLGAYVATCLYFAYIEGYKGFQLKFAPLVVKRSFTIQPRFSTFHHTLFAPFYAMGLFHATKKRKIVSWSVSIGVAGIVAVVKRFPYPWRNIVDAGVVVGLSWGTLCIVIGYVKALLNGGDVGGVDAALPE